MVGQAVGEDYESWENACPSRPAPFCQDEFEAKSDAKKLEIQCEKHAQSAELETVYDLWGPVDSCFPAGILARCPWAESIHVFQISRALERQTSLAWRTVASAAGGYRLVKAPDLFSQERVIVVGLHSQVTWRIVWPEVEVI